MPALVNISVGSLRGTSGDDGTISWPLSAKNFRKVDLISLTPLISAPSRPETSTILPRTKNSRPAFRQGCQRCPESVQADQGLAAPRPVYTSRSYVDSLGGGVFASYVLGDSRVGRDRLWKPAPKEQP